MRVLSWNVQGVFPPKPYDEKIPEQVEFICSLDPVPDIVLLQEVSRHRTELWRKTLHDDADYHGIVDSMDWAEELGESTIPPHHQIGHSNGNITAVKNPEAIELVAPSIKETPFGETDLKQFQTNFPEKILVTVIQQSDIEIEVWNVRAVPGNSWGEEKVKIFETVYNRLIAEGSRLRILAGDFNSPDYELADGQAVPFGYDKDRDIWQRYVNAELNILKGLGSLGMIDVFRMLHGYGERDILDVSHPTTTDDPLSVPPEEITGKRFDHIIASQELHPTECVYKVSGFEHSDHAPIIADFSLRT